MKVFAAVVGAFASLGGLVGRVLPPRTEAGRLRRALKRKDLNATAKAELATELAVVLFRCAPGTNVSRSQFAEGRRHAELAQALDPESWAAYRAERALHLALGDAEESLLPSSFVLAQDADPVRGYTEHAEAMLVAACSNACAARYLEMNPDKQSRGMETASARRAAALWRVMETGRLFRNASLADPTNEHAAKAANKTAHFVELDAFKGSTTNQLIDLADCRPYVGTKLDGKVCPAGRKKKKKKAAEPIVNYNENKIGPGVVKRD